MPDCAPDSSEMVRIATLKRAVPSGEIWPMLPV